MVTQLEDRALPAAIMGLVYYDTNNDGIKNNNEATAPNIPVSYTPVMGGSPVSGNTDTLGWYCFTEVASGSYNISFTAPTGYSVGTVIVTTSSGSFSGPPSNGSTLISVGTENVNVDAGLVVAGSPPVSPPPPSPPPPPGPPPPPPPPSIGNSFVVNTTGDLGDALLGDGQALDSNGKTSLRAAIQEANNNVAVLTMIGFDPVVFPGSGTTTITLNDALPAINGTMNINGPGETSLTISGANIQQRGIFFIGGSSVTQIQNLTIANGTNLVNAGLGDGRGGGIANAGNLRLDHVTITDCTANDGGGLFNGSVDGGTTILSSKIVNNTAIFGVGRQGAGGGVLSDQNTVAINNSTIQGNKADKAGGGAAAIALGRLVLTDTDLIGNWTTGAESFGGAVYNSAAYFSMTRGMVHGNTAMYYAGGVSSGGETILNAVTLSNNAAGRYGGAINVTANDCTLNSCTFTNTNTAGLGGPKVAVLGTTPPNHDNLCVGLEVFYYSAP